MENLLTFGLTLTFMFAIQTLLSTFKNMFLGLILPVATFLISLIIFLNITSVTGVARPELISISIVSLFLCNLPTYILLGIYKIIREKIPNRKSIFE